MASLLFSISFLMPLSVPKFSFKELQLRKSAVSRLSGQPSSGTATNLLVICNATGELLSVNQSCGGCPTTPTTHFYELVSSCMHVSSCTHKIITGYWVGPDIEDGWGFVEGFVNQIT
ncbi:cyclin-H1 [Salix suchowensis]|nr:cyclin-H1 [Salix suchowensis]